MIFSVHVLIVIGRQLRAVTWTVQLGGGRDSAVGSQCTLHGGDTNNGYNIEIM